MPSFAVAFASRSTRLGYGCRARVLRTWGLSLVGAILTATTATAGTTYRARSISADQAPPPYGLRLDGFYDGLSGTEATFHFDDTYFDRYDDGTALLRGELTVAEFNNVGAAGSSDVGPGIHGSDRYLLNVHFVQITDPAQIALIDNYRADWTYYNIAPNGVEMQKVGASADSTHFWTYPATGAKPFRVGYGANEINQNLGAAGKLAFKHYKYSQVYGSGPNTYIDASEFLMDLEPLDLGPCDSVKTVDNFTLRFLGVTYDLEAGTSRWDYELTWDGSPPELSQLTMELCCELTNDDLVSASPSNGHIGRDGSTGLYGIKWDPPPPMPPGEPVTFSFTLNRLLEVDETGFFPKAAVNYNYAQICGPSLDCSELTTPCLGNTPPVVTAPADTSIQLCSLAPICLPGFSCFDAEGDVISSTVTGGTLNDGEVCFTPTEGVHTIILSCIDSCGAEGSDTVQVTVSLNDPPVVQAPPVPDPIVCVPEDGIVCIPGWTFSDPDGDELTFGTMGSGTFDPVTGTFCKIVGAPGQYTMMLAVSDSCGATATTSLTFQVTGNQPPSVSIAAGSEHLCEAGTVCVPLVVNDEEPTTLQFESNLGQVESGQLCFPADTSGAYFLIVTITDSCGLMASDSVLFGVTINRPPDLVISGPGGPELVTLCDGVDVACLEGRLFVTDPDAGDSVTVTLPPGVLWDKESGALCLSEPVTGEYSIIVNAADTCGATVADTLQVVVQVGAPPVLEFSMPDDTTLFLCDPDTSLCFTVTAQGSEPITIEEVLNPGFFDPATGVFCFNPDSVCFDNPATMDTTICIVFRAANVCDTVLDSFCVTLVLNRAPMVRLPDFQTVNACEPGIVCLPGAMVIDPDADQLQIETSPGASYDNGVLCLTASEPGRYEVWLCATDPCGNVTCDTTEIEVRMNTAPTVQFGDDPYVYLCEPGDVCIDLPLINDIDGEIPTLQIEGARQEGGQLCFAASGSGTYTVVVRATDSCGASGEDTIQVTVAMNRAPRVLIRNAPPLTLCSTDTVLCYPVMISDIDGSPIANVQLIKTNTRFWSWNGSTLCLDAAAGLEGRTEATFQAIVEVTDSCGAKGRDTVQVQLKANQPPQAALPGDTTLVLCEPEEVCIGPVRYGDPEEAPLDVQVEGGVLSGDEICVTALDDTLAVVVITVRDACGFVSTDTMRLDIHINEPPAVDLPDFSSLSVCAFQPYCVDGIAGTDPDNGIIPVTLISGPGSFDPQTGRLCFTPDQDGLYTFVFEAQDECVAVQAEWNVQVTTSQPPVFGPLPDSTLLSCTPGDSLCLDFSATDPEGDPIRYILTSGPGRIDSLTGTICFAPDSSGTYLFTVVAADSCGQSQPATGRAIVQVNRPPALVFSSPDTTITLCHSDTELCFQVTATDPDGGPLVIEEVLVPGFYDPASGGFCFNPDSICFEPPLKMDTTVCVVFSVTDSCGVTTIDSLCVGLRVNRPPQLHFSSPDTTLYICRLDTQLCFGVTATDADGDPVEIREILNPGEYFPETGTFCFQPSSVCYPNLPCSEPPTCIIFEAEDACGNITRDSLCLEIFANLRPVVVAPESLTVTLCEPGQEICISPVYGHDVEDGALLVTAPPAVYDSLMQTLCFTADTAGLYLFTASVTDACAATDSQVIAVRVTANVPPQVLLPVDTVVSLCESDTVCFDVVVTDPGDTWTVTQVTGPAYFDTAQGRLCVAVTAGPTITVTVTVADPCGATATDSLQIEPLVNRPPQVNLPADFAVKVCQPGPYCFGPVAISDPDGNLVGPPVVTGGTYNADSGFLCIEVTANAIHTVIVSGTDSCGLTHADTVTVDVTLNRAPVTSFSVPDTSMFLCTPDTSLCFVFSAVDPDGGLVLLNEILNPGTFDPLTGEFCFNPMEVCFDHPDHYDTTLCLIFSATDTCGLEVWDTLCIQVTANAPPLVVAPADTTITDCQGDSICLGPFVITDENGSKDPLAITSSGPEHALDPATGRICFVAAPGTYQFGVTATDRCGLISGDSVTVTVLGNRPPTVTLPADFSTTACAGEVLCIPVTATDPDAGDSVVVVALTPQAVYDQATASVCLSPDTAGQYLVIVEGADRCGLSDRDTLRVTVTMNRTPFWVTVPQIDTSFCTTPGLICFSVSAQDPDGHELTYTKTQGPGTIDSLTGQICFNPGTVQGLYNFVVKASDPCGASVTDTARVNVRLNQPPVFGPVRDTLVAQCQPAPICFPPLVANDPDGGTLTYSLLAGSGSLSGNVYCFTPDTSGLYRIQVKVTDVCGGADTVLFFASVSMNQPPVLTLPSARTEFLCSVREVCVGGISALDPESGPVTTTKTAGPGSFNPTTGQVCFTPSAAGTYHFDFAATDTCGAQSTGRVTVTVLLNRAPTLDVPDRITACRDSVVCIPISGLDPDIGNRLTITQLSGPAGVFNPSPLSGPAPLSGEWCWTAQAAGSYLAVFQVADSCGSVAVDTTHIDVSDYCDTLCFAASIPAICPDEDHPDYWLFQGRAHQFPIMVTPSRDVGAFDFLIGYDASALTVQGVQRGADISAWEFFTYRMLDPDFECSGACPSGLLRIVGIADINNGSPISDPSQTHASAQPREYARIVFQVSNDRTLAGQFVPVDFWWNDCGDNTFSSPLGDLYVANTIDPDTCVGAGAKEAIDACATFQGGGGCIPRASDIDDRGDLNLNSIAYEIADAVLYSNYFILGRQAFDPDPLLYESQVAASDVNADGGVLTVADLVFLIRIIVGLQEPIDGGALLRVSPAGEASVYWVHDGPESRLVLENPGALGALAIEAQCAAAPEHVELSDAAREAGMEIRWHFEGDRLKVLVYSMTGAALKPGSEPLVTFTAGARPESIRAEASDDKGRVVTVQLKSAPIVPVAFDLDPNIPNPFNPETEIRFTLHADAVVDLVVFNVLGQPLAHLVESERLVAGTHRYRWLALDERGGNLPSGVYMYRLSADGYSETRKMLLLR